MSQIIIVLMMLHRNEILEVQEVVVLAFADRQWCVEKWGPHSPLPRSVYQLGQKLPVVVKIQLVMNSTIPLVPESSQVVDGVFASLLPWAC